MTSVHDALRRLAARGERFPVDAERSADALAADGWTRSDALADRAAWPAIARAYATTVGTTRTTVGGSCALQGYAGRIASTTIACWTQTGALLDLSPERVWVRLVDGRTLGVAVPERRLRSSRATVEELADELLVRHLGPVVAAARPVSRISERVAWGNVASACASAFGTLDRTAPPAARPAIRAAARAFLAAGGWPRHDLLDLRELPGPDGDALVHERRTCCLMRLSAEKEECASCERLTPAIRRQRLVRSIATATVPAPLPVLPEHLRAAALGA